MASRVIREAKSHVRVLQRTILQVFRTGTWLTVRRALDILKLAGDPMGGAPQRLSVLLTMFFQILNVKQIRHALTVLAKF